MPFLNILIIVMFILLNLRLANAIHNFKWVKIIQIIQVVPNLLMTKIKTENNRDPAVLTFVSARIVAIISISYTLF